VILLIYVCAAKASCVKGGSREGGREKTRERGRREEGGRGIDRNERRGCDPFMCNRTHL